MQAAVGVQTACAPEEVCDKGKKKDNLKKKQERDSDTKTNVVVYSTRQRPWQQEDETEKKPRNLIFQATDSRRNAAQWLLYQSLNMLMNYKRTD